jgi:OOP family OmpA-OmpF porin
VNIKQVIALTGLIAAAAGISPLAFAQYSGLYLGGSAGQSKVKDYCAKSLPVGASCDDRSSAFSAFLGNQFNRYLGIEVGYSDLGEFNASGTGTTLTNKVKGVEFLGVGTIPINPQFEVYGKVGAFSWEAKRSCSGASCVFSSQKETGTELTYALGAQFNFSRNIGARVQLQRYQDVGEDATTGKSDIDVLSVGIVFKF